MQGKHWEDTLELGPDCYERFLHRDNVPELLTMGIGYAGVSELRGRYWVGRRKPDYHTALFTLEGRGKLELDGSGSVAGNADKTNPDSSNITSTNLSSVNRSEQFIEPNTLTLLPLGNPFRFSLAAERWATAWFCFDDTPQWQHLTAQQPGVRYCPSSAAVFHLLCQLYYEPRPTMRDGAIQQLQNYLSDSLANDGSVSQDSLEQQRRLETLFTLVQQQLHAPWTIEKMADAVHYSAPHLHRLCKQLYAQSPIQRLIHFRMERAENLLKDTDWSLLLIANSVGYQDAFNFSTRFKKSLGLSPSEYRRRNRA